MLCRRVVLLAAAVALLAVPGSARSQSLDFAVYKSSVEPIFLTKRAGYTRCAVCHGGANNSFCLIDCGSGESTYTEAQLRKNFEDVSAAAGARQARGQPFVDVSAGSGRRWCGLSFGRPAVAEQARSELAGHSRWVNGQK